MIPRSGDILHLTRDASVQFASRPIHFRVIRVHDTPTYHGWIWLDGYQLNSLGEAVERRMIFVQIKGLRPVRVATPIRRPRIPARRPATTTSIRRVPVG